MSTPLRTLVNDLLHDPSARATFAADPAGYLDDHGWGGLDGADIGTAFDALRQELPIDEAVLLGSVDTGSFGDGATGAITGLQAAAAAFDVEWSADPAMSIDEPVVEPDAAGADADDADADDLELDVFDDFGVDDLEDPLLALGEAEPFDDLDVDDGWSGTDFDDGFDDG
jgi:hypothetical protein